MKLIRFGSDGRGKPGVIINETRYDVSPFGEDYNEHFFESDGLKRLELFLQQPEVNLRAISNDVRLGPPIARPSKIVCIGLNYADHARETNAAIPSEPVLFMKSTTSLA